MSTNDVISFKYSFAEKITRNAHGGIIFNDKASMSLLIKYCSFNSCHVTEAKFNGGFLYFTSTTSHIKITNVLAKDCSSYSGNAMYITNTQLSTTSLSYISTSSTYGNERCCVYCKGSNSCTRFYNTSFCRAGKHCNIHFFGSGSSDIAYVDVYKCSSDILVGVDISANVEQIFRFGNFIENGKSEGSLGYVYTNSHSSLIFRCSNLCFKGNSFTLLCANGGIIEISNSTYDVLTTRTISGIVRTNSLIKTSTYPEVYNFVIFEKIYNSTLQPSKHRYLSSLFFFVLISRA